MVKNSNHRRENRRNVSSKNGLVQELMKDGHVEYPREVRHLKT